MSEDYGTFQFRVKRWVLAGLAEAVLPAVSPSAVQPVLACFRVRVGDGFLELAATDMERTILASSAAVQAEDAADGTPYEVFIPARKLQAILKEAPDSEVTVQVAKNKATINAGAVQVLLLPDSSDYPALIDVGTLDFSQYSREKLLTGLKAVRHVVCKDAGRPPLTQVSVIGTSLEEDPDGVAVSSVTASDGIRFARSKAEGFPVSMCIPSSVLDDLTKLLGASQEDEIGIALTDEALVFRTGWVTLAVTRRSTPFPDMDRLLLQPALENEDVLRVTKDELAAAVRRVRINADSETSAIALELGEGSVKVVARDKTGNSASEGIVADWKGAARVLCVNHVFLTEMLNAHPEATCEFRIGQDLGKRRSMILLTSPAIIQVIAQMAPALVGY